MALCVSLAVFALELLHPDDLGARAAGSATPILRWLVVLAVADGGGGRGGRLC